MSLQWMWRIMYIIFIGAITYLVASFSEASKVVNFLADREEFLMSNDTALIAATVIANNHNSTDVYVRSFPLYEESFLSATHAVKISIYPLVEFKDDKAHNSIALLLKDIMIDDNEVVKDDDYHIMRASIEFDRNLAIGDGDEYRFTELMTPLYDDTGRMMIINQELLQTPTGQAQFQKIAFTYDVSLGLAETLVVLSNSNLTEVTASDVFDVSYDRDMINLSLEQLDLLSAHGLTNLEQNDNIYYNPLFIEELNSYNRYYLQYISIELAIVLPLTYLFFFHKHVKKRIQEKKWIQQTHEHN